MKQLITTIRLLSYLTLLLCFKQTAFAEPLEIDITEGGASGIPIAIVPFMNSNSAQHNVSDIIAFDLSVSGRFDLIPQRDFLNRPSDAQDVNYKDWRLLKTEVIVLGKVIPQGAGFQVSFELLDVGRALVIETRVFNIRSSQLRQVAHQISDLIYLTLTGKPGAFDSRIAYITRQGMGARARYLLQVADSDGYGSKNVLESSEPILSPTWSPDGRRLAYVSLRKGRSVIYMQDLGSGSRQLVSSSKGINSSPAFSPDGTRLAMSLSKDGNSEIYIKHLSTGALTRVTNDRSIDTEPAWSPDGRSLLFTSGRSGKPQIYRVSDTGADVQRVTFQGRYNANASYSPDAKYITMVTDQGQGHRIGLLDVATGNIQTLTNSDLDESPSFAPNGEMILYATKSGRSGVLSVVSDLGRVAQQLRFQRGDVREPAWSSSNRKL